MSDRAGVVVFISHKVEAMKAEAFSDNLMTPPQVVLRTKTRNLLMSITRLI
jgi:hypothetical protein